MRIRNKESLRKMGDNTENKELRKYCLSKSERPVMGSDMFQHLMDTIMYNVNA